MRKLVIAALTLGVLATMAALRVSDLRWSRGATLQAADARAVNLAVMVSGYLGEAFASGDASLRQLALHSRRVGGPAAPARHWMPSLASAKAGLTGIGAITVVDAGGIIRHSTRPEIIGESRRGDYLTRTTLSAATDDLVVGTPFKTIQKPPRIVIPIGRRLTTEEGVVEGAVVASYIPAVPQRFLRTLDVGTRGSMWVFHPAGVVLFREPSTDSDIHIGQPARGNPIFQAAIRQGGSGSLRAPVSDDGPVLLSAYHNMGTPPLVVAASLDEDEVLADWTHEAIGAAVLFGVATVMMLATLALLFHQMNAKSRVEHALARAQQLEAERLRDANDRLEVALQREQGARRDAEAASALKDEFLMMVSHELRTPLTAIYGWTRMLVAGTVGDRQRDAALRTIERNARAQARLIDDLLDLSASAGGKLRLDVRLVDIARVVQEAVDTVIAAAEAKRIRISTRVDAAAARVSGDTDRLQQIVWNLLSNAVKFTPAGGRVDVTVSRVGDVIEIAVTDTGAGISPEFLPHVFDRFRQEDAGANRRYGGLGLGLAIVRNLAELHGGSVAAYSGGPQRGTRMVVRLPAPTGQGSLKPDTPRPLDGGDAAPLLEGVRILIVDDDPETRLLFTTILERAGATVTAAASASEALAALRDTRHDVLVSDIAMPGADGYALLRDALALARRRNERLVAVAVTAYGRPEDEARSIAAGFNRHVPKPVDPPTLVEAVLSVWNEALQD